MARAIAQSIFAERKLHSTVLCPGAVPQEVGKTFECVATTSTIPKGSKHAVPVKTPFVVTIQSTKGYVTYVGK